MNKAEYAEYCKAVDRNLEGLTAVSSGNCPGCDECYHGDECSPDDCQCEYEPSFSCSSCDSCGSNLGGDRHPAHGINSDGEILHLEVCSDCVYFLAYGELDDWNMNEVNR